MFHIESMEWVKRGPGRPKHEQPHPPQENHFKMKEMYLSGKTLQEIGSVFDISRERVRQLLKKHFGITGVNGGVSIRHFVVEADKQKHAKQKRQQKIANVLGCTVEFFDSVNEGKNMWVKGTPAYHYLQQKRNARNRGIEWKFNLKDWWEIWQQSGKWDKRGRGQGYCMTRIGDTGAYEVDNVEIKTIGENFSDSFYKHPQAARRQKIIDRGGNPSVFVKKEFCKRGHKLSGDNLIFTKIGDRMCKACNRIRNLEYYYRNKHKKEENAKP